MTEIENIADGTARQPQRHQRAVLHHRRDRALLRDDRRRERPRPAARSSGWASQLVDWPREFCEGLAARGFHVIRFDNRDSGRSTHLTDSPPPTRRELVTGRIRRPAYTLEDMARDASRSARSPRDRARPRRRPLDGRHDRPDPGGAVARARPLARLDHVQHRQPPRRTAQPAALAVLPDAAARRSRALHPARRRPVRASPARPATTPTSPTRARCSASSFDRGMSPDGFGRQIGAIFATGNRTRALRQITAPTLVIHGLADRVVAPSGGRATARAIRDATPHAPRRHGPRHPPRAVAPDHRRHRSQRRAGRACSGRRLGA